MLLLLIITLVSCRDCTINFGFLIGEVNLGNIPPMEVNFTKCNYYLSLLVDLCNNVEASECPSTSTRGPGNACDGRIFSSSPVYYWIGEADNRTNSQYDTKKKSFSLTYYGINQIVGTSSWVRNLEVDMYCSKEPSAECKGIDVDESQETTTYQIKINNNEACPSKSG